MVTMKKIYLINFSLMEKIADKKNGITTENAAAFITGVELFFIYLMIEFVIMKFLPFKLKGFIVYGAMAVIWYYTHHSLRKSLTKKITSLGIRKTYKELSRSKQKSYLILSILIFFAVFFIFLATGALTIYNYNKR